MALLFIHVPSSDQGPSLALRLILRSEATACSACFCSSKKRQQVLPEQRSRNSAAPGMALPGQRSRRRQRLKAAKAGTLNAFIVLRHLARGESHGGSQVVSLRPPPSSSRLYRLARALFSRARTISTVFPRPARYRCCCCYSLLACHYFHPRAFLRDGHTAHTRTCI